MENNIFNNIHIGIGDILNEIENYIDDFVYDNFNVVAKDENGNVSKDFIEIASLLKLEIGYPDSSCYKENKKITVTYGFNHESIIKTKMYLLDKERAFYNRKEN